MCAFSKIKKYKMKTTSQKIDVHQRIKIEWQTQCCEIDKKKSKHFVSEIEKKSSRCQIFNDDKKQKQFMILLKIWNE